MNQRKRPELVTEEDMLALDDARLLTGNGGVGRFDPKALAPWLSPKRLLIAGLFLLVVAGASLACVRFTTKRPSASSRPPSTTTTSSPTSYPTSYPTSSSSSALRPPVRPSALRTHRPTHRVVSSSPPTTTPTTAKDADVDVGTSNSTVVADDYVDANHRCDFGDGACKGTTVGLGTKLFPRDHLCSSSSSSDDDDDGHFRFGLGAAGHLVLCEGDRVVWSQEAVSPTLRLQRDGNLVLTSNATIVVWRSRSIGVGVSSLALSADGVASLETADGRVVWSVPHNESWSRPDDDEDDDDYDDGGQIYLPGQIYYDRENNLYLARGLNATRFGTTGENVTYADGRNSSRPVHDQPDAGACFDSSGDDGGFVYVSNEETNDGGVGAFKFDREGRVADYKMILSNTKRNCGGGKSPWGTWITGEESRNDGFFHEVHPTGRWSQKTNIVTEGGNYESAAFDDRDMTRLKVFGTNDKSNGELTRYVPNTTVLEAAVRSGDYRRVLSSEGGFHHYLVLTPANDVNDESASTDVVDDEDDDVVVGTFAWTANRTLGQASAELHFPHAEGVDHHNGLLFFVSKKLRRLYVLNLDDGTYVERGTTHGKFDGQPDQILHVVDPYDEEAVIYFTEDGGPNAAGIYAQTTGGRKFTVVEGGEGTSDETTGFAICDRGTKLIMAFQDEGHLYLIQRRDGKRFEGDVVDLKYHDELARTE